MSNILSNSEHRWLRLAQLAVGAACIALSIFVAFSPKLGTYAVLVFAGTAFMVLGAERIAAGISSKHDRKSTRVINVAIGAGILGWMLSGFFFPEAIAKYFVLFLGFGLIANGVLRIISGLRHTETDAKKYSSLVAGVLSLSIGIIALAVPIIGFALLIIITSVALAVSGIQVILIAVRGSKIAQGSQSLKATAPYPYANVQDRLSSSGIWKNGTWFCDEEGRFMLFRGVNFASRSKLPPYLPIAPLEVTTLSKLELDREIAAVREELDHLKEFGFNIVRLLISWKAIEPRPNPNPTELLPEGRSYLTYVKKIIDELYARKLYVILDFHQDIAHEVYGGDGFPDWAIAIDEDHSKPEQAGLKDKKWLLKYAVNKSVKNTLSSFWKNDLTNKELGFEHFPVRTHLETTIGQVERFFHTVNDGQGHPAILGIEPFNEPHPVGLPKEKFEESYLLEYYRNVNAELAKYGPDVFLFMEPRVDWTVSKSEEQGLLGSGPFTVKGSFHTDLVKNVLVEGNVEVKQINTYLPKDIASVSTFRRNGVLSFHYYDPMAVASSFVRIPESMYTYRRQWPAIFDQLIRSATERDLIPFLTEFGGYQEAEEVRDYINLLFEQIESHLLNATYWNYDLYATTEGKDNWNLEDYSLLGPKRQLRNVDVVARPYPMRSSAEPKFLSFDTKSKYATIILEGPVRDAPTIVYIPFNIHYTPQFSVWGTGKTVKWDRNNQLLHWMPSKDLATNQIVIGKQNVIGADALPVTARKSLSDLSLLGTFA